MKVKIILVFIITISCICISCIEKKSSGISIYDIDGFVKIDGKFEKNQFVDSIFVYKEKDDETYNDYFDTFIVIDSTIGTFYYGTELVQEKITSKLFSKGTYRFQRNSNPEKSFKSGLRVGLFTVYERDGTIHSEDFYKIKEDSSYTDTNVTQ